MVEASRFDRMTMVRIGRRTIAVEAGHWLIESEDGTLVTMSDSVFQRWYAPIDYEAKRALTERMAFAPHSQQARPTRLTRKKAARAVSGQGFLDF
jgi:hypothetical protein